MTALPSRRPSTTESDADQAVNDFQGETEELIGQPYPIKARSTLWLFAGMLVTLVVLSSVTGVDRVVATSGRIVPKTPTIVVQPLETSIIRSIDVHAGQTVHKGDVLAALDPTFATADLAQLRAKARSLEVEISRLDAEASNVAFAPQSQDPDSLVQASIWKYRKAELAAKLANYDQRMETSQATINRAQGDARYFEARRDILAKVETMRNELERNQVGSRLNALAAADSRIEVERNLAQAEATMRASSHDLEALKAERDAYAEQWRSETLTNLVNKRTEYAQAKEELAKAERRHDLVALRAVDDAVVLDIGHFSVGSVVEGARQLFTLMPANAPLEVEAELSTTDQGSVKVGDSVQIKLDAYRYLKYGMAKGLVRTISQDTFSQRDDGTQLRAPVYRVRIELTDVALHDLPENFRMIPGMTVVAEIIVGQRSIMSYLLEGVTKDVNEGIREP